MVDEEPVRMFLSKNGIDKKGTKYQVRRECLDKIDLNWAGYNQAQKTQIQELIQEAKRQKIESVPVQPDPSSKRKSNVSGQMPSSKRPRPQSNLSPEDSSESSDSPGSNSTISQSTASEISYTTQDARYTTNPIACSGEKRIYKE